MTLLKGLAISVPVALLAAAGAGFLHHRSGAADADKAWRDIAAREPPASARFDPAMVADQPEIARRYFAHAIAPGTLLASIVELQMRGTFLLGEKASHQTFAMTARQILRPPSEFVWIPRLNSGLMTITGSDALVAEDAWTRFWLMSVVPVANVGTSVDVLRSAAFRSASEGLWVPSSLLPRNGVVWEQTGPDSARLTFTRVKPAITLQLTLDKEGAVREVTGLRWSNANPEKRFRLQPFGGTIEAEARFGGFTIPARLSVGNHFGTDDYLPFFQAEITSASYR
jgi:hypothetical protein